ncbi:hypothetical protein N665_0225s0008 [Sinapis alba]|nr:hypothetical protein N665_0225s0008 [Sinapis alba]
MDDLDLPCRLFLTGFEPTRKKRVNNYFNLRWIEVIKGALEDDDLTMLNASQFFKLLQLGDHVFSVMFLHYLLSRQLVTEKEFELWWLFVGKPIRYAIQDFALVTGLNSGETVDSRRHKQAKGGARGKGSGKSKSSTSAPSIWDVLFCGEEKPTTSWIMDCLVKGKKYKDPLTRLRLALLVLVEGILCPTCGTTNIRPEVVSMLGNLDEFLAYPWGRESFMLTVRSTKSRSPSHYVLQDTMAIQGFAHAMVLVTVAAFPTLLLKPGAVALECDSDETTEEIVQSLLDRRLTVNFVNAKAVDQKGQAFVRSRLSSDEAGERLYRGLQNKEDDGVDQLHALLSEDYPFEQNTWSGGVKADDIKVSKGAEIPADSLEPDTSSEGQDGAAGLEGGTHSGANSRERGGPSCMRPSEAPTSGGNVSGSVADLVPMFEGYMVRIKEHITTEFGSLCTEVASACASIATLDFFVRNEYASLRNSLNNSHPMDTVDPFSTYSPHRHAFPTGASFSNTQPGQDASVPMTTHNDGTQSDILADVDEPPLIDTPGEDQCSLIPDAIDAHSAPSEYPTDLGCVRPEEEHEISLSDLLQSPFLSDKPNSSPHLHVSGSDAEAQNSGRTPISDSVAASPSEPASHSLEASVPITMPPHVPSPISTTTAQSDTQMGDATIIVQQVPLGSGLNRVHSSLSGAVSSTDVAAGPADQVSGSLSLDPTNIIQPCVSLSTAPHVPTSHLPSKTAIDPMSKSAEDVVVKKSGVKQSRVGRGGQGSAPLPPDGFLRFSKRTRTNPDRYTPTEVPRKQEQNKRSHRSSKEKVPKAADKPTVPLTETTRFLGGFEPFMPPEPTKRTAFMQAIDIAAKKTPADGVGIQLGSLLAVFECTKLAPPEGLDLVIEFIRKRCLGLPDSRFDFFDTSFFTDLLRSFPEFNAWKSHWVGVIVDLNMWAMYVVDANKCCPTPSAVASVITPISIILPHLIARFSSTTRAQELNYVPLTMTRLDIPFLIDHPGCSAMVMLMLFELHAGGKDLTSVSFTEEQARAAAEKYAIETLEQCNSC